MMKTKDKMKNRKQLTTFLLLSIYCVLLPGNLFSQSANGSFDPNGLPNLLGIILLITGAVVIFGTLAVLFKLFFLILLTQKNRMYVQQGIPIPEQVVKPPLWQRFYERSTKVVPLEKEADILLDHNYDGIKELDNALPPWWVAMFYITIAMGVVYFGYFHYYEFGPLSAEEYAIEMERAEAAKERYQQSQANNIDLANLVTLTDEGALATGGGVFNVNCAACHGQLGEGGVGPNLTDNYSIHGADIKSVFLTVKNGVPEKGMIAWKTQIRPADIHAVSSYIMTLKGTNPPNAKEPQGDLIVEDSPKETQEEELIGTKE